MGRHLDSIAGESVRVLHDRRVPGRNSNIDHIVVTAHGVWVVDTKRYKDKRPSLRADGGIVRPRTEVLLVGGRDQTKLVDGVLGQVERVASVVGEEPVRGVLCFVDAEWPLIGGGFVTRAVEVLWPAKLLKLLQAPAVDACDVGSVGASLERVFRPSVRG